MARVFILIDVHFDCGLSTCGRLEQN
ncbi:hypothetical protein D039_3802A, partial [Vibrio parahaemolyticus EKP-028]